MKTVRVIPASGRTVVSLWLVKHITVTPPGLEVGVAWKGGLPVTSKRLIEILPCAMFARTLAQN